MPTKVAILGGGMASLATAWKLSDPQLGNQFDVTVYQRDGLLGGKGASVRSSVVGQGDRIHEHGIHILMGFYDNALTLLKDCYAELAQSGGGKVFPFADALTPWDEVTIAAKTPAGWDFQKVPFPVNQLPFGGDGKPPYIPALFANALGWFASFLAMLGIQVPLPGVSLLKTLVLLFVNALVFIGQLGLPVSFFFGIVKWWIDKVLQMVWLMVSGIVDSNREVRWLWAGLWFVGTNLRGIIDEGILAPPNDFSGMNGQDYKLWLQSQSPVSPPPEHSWDSPLVQAAYDIAFSYGHPLEAGVMLYNLLLIGLGYKEHFAYKMNAGMGEVVFSPLYHALVGRGVHFEFHSTVTKVSGDFDTTGTLMVDAIDLTVEGDSFAAFDPFTDSTVEIQNGSKILIDTWTGAAPPENILPQLRTLTKGTDFDVVVLGISVAALPGICQPIASKDPGFDQMMLQLQTVPTQSVQLWLDQSLTQLGWTGGATSLVSFSRPFNSWLDMSQTLKSEDWVTPPQTIAYFSDEYLPDTTGAFPTDVVWARLVSFAQNDLPLLWPGFTLDALHAPTGTVGLDRLGLQYWRANVDLSDQYVLPAAGTDSVRLAADGSSFRNLALSGDWVRTSLNTGNLEAATMAGYAAAAAISNGQVHA